MKKTIHEEKLTAEPFVDFYGWSEKNEGRLWKILPLNLTTIQWIFFLLVLWGEDYLKININDMLFLRKLRSVERTDLGASVSVGRICVRQLKIISLMKLLVIRQKWFYGRTKNYVWRKSNERLHVNVQKCLRTERS